MRAGKNAEREGFLSALLASGRSPEIPESSDVYGWLIGSWELDVLHYLVDVTDRGLKAEAHFGWVLEGRAVQDVWIMPPRSRVQLTRTRLRTCTGRRFAFGTLRFRLGA
jgi:hypothetical protein